MKIYVGNLSHQTVEAELRETFEKFGEVTKVDIVTDRYDGRPRGFGFVEMPSADQAKAAIAGLNGKEVGGRTLNVNEARPSNPGGGGGNRRGGGGGGRRY